MRIFYSLLTILVTASLWAQSPDFLTGSIFITPDLTTREITGKVDYTFRVRKSVDTLKIDAIGMRIDEIRVNKRKVNYTYNDKVVSIVGPFHNGKHELSIRYFTKPKQTVYFTESPHGPQVWTQGQGKESSHWVPSFTNVNEKVIFDIAVELPAGYTFIANGEHRIKQTQGDKVLWKYAMRKPISSYLLAFVIGHFEKQEQLSENGVAIENYYEAHELDKVEPTYRYTAQMMDFLEKEIGYNYPWHIYRNVPLRNFLYGGMENTTLTTFNRTYMVDSIAFKDVNYVNVNAHEMAHHWFGDLVTAKESKHHWLQEGFATYYALLAEEHVFGTDYMTEKLYSMALELQKASATDTIPVLNAKASSLSFYKKGAWALHYLRDKIGKPAFDRAVRSYVNEFAYESVETSDFFKHIAKESNYDLVEFKTMWLESKTFPIAQAMEILAKTDLMQSVFELSNYPAIEDPDQRVARYKLLVASNSRLSDLHWEEMIFQWNLLDAAHQLQLFDLINDTPSTHAKLVWLYQQKQIPTQLQPQIAQWLNLDSYVLKEMVLDRLCREFSSDCASYLNQTAHLVGFNDYNIRQLWLTMALKLKGYRPEDKPKYYDELLTLAKSPNEFNTRIGAISKLMYLHRADENVLPLLAESLTSHNWQFSKFGRDTLRELLPNPNYRAFFEKLLPSLPLANQKELQRLLNEKKAPQ